MDGVGIAVQILLELGLCGIDGTKERDQPGGLKKVRG